MEIKTILVTDAAYSEKRNRDLISEKNIHLVNIDLLEKSIDDILANFVFNEARTTVLRCQAGYEPKSCGYIESKSL